MNVLMDTLKIMKRECASLTLILYLTPLRKLMDVKIMNGMMRLKLIPHSDVSLVMVLVSLVRVR